MGTYAYAMDETRCAVAPARAGFGRFPSCSRNSATVTESGAEPMDGSNPRLVVCEALHPQSAISFEQCVARSQRKDRTTYAMLGEPIIQKLRILADAEEPVAKASPTKSGNDCKALIILVGP